VYEEATVYKKERNSERARAEVREENAVRKKQGLSALKLPPKFSAEDKKKKGKAKKDKGKSRRKRLLGSDAEDLSSSSEEDEQFEYEGQRSLGFDPLPILAGEQLSVTLS
jgi:hypothetical protein